MEYTSSVSRAGRHTPAGVRLFFWVLLAVSAAVRCVLACFPKAAYTYADELVYLELAQNIWLRGSLSLLHAPTNFSKILYPLLISPFYAITAPESRSIAISVFNALLTSSALIPGYLLARKFLRKPWQLCAALLALALAPELMFSMTYMAECLYIPLALWVILFFVSAFENGLPSPARSAAGGGLLFLLYLTKESGLALAAGALALYLGSLAAPRSGNPLAGRDEKKQGGLSLLALLAAFGLLFLLFRFVFFGGMPYSYVKQAGLNMAYGTQSILYILASAAVLLIFLLGSFFYFPAVLPLSEAGRMDRPQRSLLILSFVSLLCAALGTAFGVSLPESFPTLDLRTHLRYFSPLFFPFLVLLLASADLPEGERKFRPGVVISAAVFLALLFLLPRAIRFGSLVDAPQLYSFVSLPAENQMLLLRLLLAAVVVAGTVLMLLGRRKPVILLSLCLFLGFSAWSSAVFCREARRNMEVPPELSREAAVLDETLNGLEGNILVIRPASYTAADRVFDTWVRKDFYLVQNDILYQKVMAARLPGTLDLSAGELLVRDCVSGALFPADADSLDPLERVDWIVCCDPHTSVSHLKTEDITPAGVTIAKVYRNLDPACLSVLDPGSYRVGTEIPFYDAPDASSAYLISGFGSREPAFTWTVGAEALIVLSPDLPAPMPLTASFQVVDLMGAQHVSVFANDLPVFDGEVPGPGVYSFEVPAEAVSGETGQLTFRFLLPDAREPGNGDTRKLSLAFRSFMLTGDPFLLTPSAYDPGTELRFYGDDVNAAQYPLSGFSGTEPAFTWTDGKAARIALTPQNLDGHPDLTGSFTVAAAMGPQHVLLTANGYLLFEGVLEGPGTYDFRVPRNAYDPENPRLTFTFELPDALRPDNGDPRELGLAFVSFILYPAQGE